MRLPGTLTGASVVALAVLGCTDFTGDSDRAVAIQISTGQPTTLEEGDTLSLQAQALNASGDFITDAPIVWTTLDVDTGQIGITLDSTTGLVRGEFPSQVRVRASIDNLRSEPLTVTVTPAPDSIALAGPDTLTMTAGEVTSDQMLVSVLDLTTDPGEEVALSGKPVTFSLIRPGAGDPEADGLFLSSPGETEPGEDPRTLTVETTGGRAAAVLRLQEGVTLPDTTAVEARSETATGQPVPGGPVLFLIIRAP